MPEEPTRRNLLFGMVERASTMPLSRSVELASAVPLAAFCAANFLYSRRYYAVDTSRAISSATSSSAQSLSAMNDPFKAALDELCSAYRSEYHRAHTRMVTYTDSKGNIRTRPEIYYVWEEPSNVPKHGVVYDWRDKHDSLASKCRELASKKIIDARLTGNVEVEGQEASRLVQGLLSAGIYGGEIALLLGYEELVARMRHRGYESKPLKELVRESNTAGQISRRSWLKVFASLVGSAAAFKVLNNNLGSLADAKGTLKKEVDRIPKLAAVEPAESFARYFGKAPAELAYDAEQVLQTCQASLGSGVANARVQKAFENVVVAARAYSGRVNGMFANGVPEDLATATTFAYITDHLSGLSSEQSLKANTGVLLEGLAIGGTIAAIVIPGEWINSHLARGDRRRAFLEDSMNG